MPTLNQFSEPLSSYLYTESSQINPLRFVIYKKEEDTYQAQAGVMKCRDYLNDLVAIKHGVKIQVYGFDNSDIEFEEDGGLFLRLFNCVDSLKERLDKVVDLPEGFSYTIEPIEGTTEQYLLYLSKEFFSSTYYISYFTLMLRGVNVEAEFPTFESLETSTEYIFRNYWKQISKYRMYLPEKYKEYWFFAGEKYNSKEPITYTRIIHDNGVIAWVDAIDRVKEEVVA